MKTGAPRSAYDKVGGMLYFARMLDKMRLHARGELSEEYHANLGRGADKWCCGFLRVDYDALAARVGEGGDDEAILEWCFEHGRALNVVDLMIWNAFTQKLGWNDIASPVLQKHKAESGLAHRDDLVTMLEFFEVDEGRKA